jgi:hypothetical protein
MCYNGKQAGIVNLIFALPQNEKKLVNILMSYPFADENHHSPFAPVGGGAAVSVPGCGLA